MWQSMMGIGDAWAFAIAPAPSAAAEPSRALRLYTFIGWLVGLCRRAGRRGRETIAELIRHACQFAVGEEHVQQLFAVHGPAVLVLHLADDLARLHVDVVPRRDVGHR